MQPIITVNNLIKRYRKAEKNAVDDISFEVFAGEFFTFLGPNGAGKTTTISILTTTLSKTSGSVKISGFDIEKESSKVRQITGIIFQNPSLDLNLTAEENIRFHCVLYGLYPFAPTYSLMDKGYQKRVDQLSEVLGIKKDMFKPLKTFSGGMKRKLEIVRSLMHKPKILFLDEPTIGLDPMSRKTLWEYLMQVRKDEKMTVFLTTHYLEEAEDADRVCIINKGKIVMLDTPRGMKQKLTNEYLTLDSKDRNGLKKELDSKKLKYEENGRLKVTVGKKSAAEVLQSIKTKLTFIDVHNPSLEDAYLEVIGIEKEKQ